MSSRTFFPRKNTGDIYRYRYGCDIWIVGLVYRLVCASMCVHKRTSLHLRNNSYRSTVTHRTSKLQEKSAHHVQKRTAGFNLLCSPPTPTPHVSSLLLERYLSSFQILVILRDPCKFQDFLCRPGSGSTAVLQHMCEEIRN